jgi:ABC-type antimicrobial peptide transport system ATPase subunit
VDLPDACRFAPRCPYANRNDGCTAKNPELRELRPGHLVRTCHPASERQGALATA